jgi:succinate dehydrogenase / fumarate reductase cytochrome b subunit
VKQKRPVNLDLSSLKYPPMAIASILHRLSGILLFFLFPWVLYLFSRSLLSEAEFQATLLSFSSSFPKILLWTFFSALIYHLLAGIRHIFMDIGWGEGLATSRFSSIFVIVLAAILIIFLGIWLW